MKKLSKTSLIVLIIVIAAAAALVGVYFWGRSHYSDHFIQGTTINGWDFSDATVKEVRDEFKNSVNDYSLLIIERGDKTETLDCKSLGMKYTDTGEIDKLMEKQNNNLWFLNIGKQHFDVDIKTEYDESAVPALVDALDCFKPENVQAPVNSHLQYNGSGFEIVPEIEGNELNRDATVAAINEAISEFRESIDLEKEGLYLQPEVRADSEAILTSLEEANKIFDVDITYDFTDRQYKLERDTLATWISTDEAGNILVDREKVAEWVGNMAYETDTFALSRDFMTSYGVPVRLAPGGDYGWCIDKEATTEQLYAYVATKQSGVLTPIYLFQANDRSMNDVGGTYVEICIATQTLWAYKDGQLLVTTPVITGCDEKGYSTPSGSVWAIDGKKTDWKFTHFENAYSDFWMPFNDECGLHDASWQSEESYTIPGYYIYGGSHGCVNTPYNAMEIIYNNLEIGDPVVVYYSTDQVVGPAPTQTLIAG